MIWNRLRFAVRTEEFRWGWGVGLITVGIPWLVIELARFLT